jgi:surface polysaccharide O-acyltransferase-like enzyme
MAEKKTRNSSIELLRILCIFGIIFMHTIAFGGKEIAEYNRYIQIFINCFTNLGVTCFMLISGYYGIMYKLERLISIDLMMIFYSVLHIVIRLVLHVETGVTDMVSAVFPVISNLYWYMTAYFIIALLSPWLNQIPERLSRESMRRILALFIFLFSAVPTFLHFDILRTEGKNVVYMAMVYLIGRYLRLYGRKSTGEGRSPYRISRLVLLLCANIAVTEVLEQLLYRTTRYYSIFYRDCSIFTLFSSVLLFTIFRNLYFENRAINRIASCVLAVYVFSYGFQRLVYLLIPLEEYAFSPLFFPRICVFAPCVVVGCLLIELLRQTLFGRAEARLVKWLADLLHRLMASAKGFRSQLLEHVEKFIM